MWACGVILILFLPLSVFLSLFSMSLSLFFFLCWEIQGKKQENKALVMGCWACVLASPVNTAIGWSCAVIAPQQAGSYYSKWSNLLSSLCFAPLKKKKKTNFPALPRVVPEGGFQRLSCCTPHPSKDVDLVTKLFSVGPTPSTSLFSPSCGCCARFQK